MTDKLTLATGAAPRALFASTAFNMMTRGPQVAFAPDGAEGGGAAVEGGDTAPAGEADKAPEGDGGEVKEGAGEAKAPPSIFDGQDEAGDAKEGEPKEGEPKEGEAKDDDKKDGEEKPEGAPEAYEAFKLPEGVTVDEATLEAATPIFKELNLPQAQAQRLVDFWMEAGQRAEAANVKAIEDFNAALIKQVKEDPDLGGAQLKSTLASAKTAIARFGDQELDDLLKTTGFGNQPAVLRFLKKVAAFDADDTIERGKGSSTPTPKFGDFYNPEIMQKKD